MNDSPTTPLFVSVVYLRMCGFERLPVVEQARARTELDSTLKAGLIPMERADRIVLDTADGFAILMLNGPVAALTLANRCLAAANLPLAIGVNHGVVAPAMENLAIIGFLGDGLRAAGIAAQSAATSKLLVTRAFREALCAGAPARLSEFGHAGVYSDSGMRTHELFAVDGAGRRRRRQRLFAVAAVVGTLFIAGGVALRKPVQQHLAAPPHATLVFDITPGGEVFVDGQSQGNTPPLDQLDLPVGSHSIEIRHPPNAPLKRALDLAAEDRVTIQYDFNKARPAGFFHQIKHKLGMDK
jgi:hypothetical protein